MKAKRTFTAMVSFIILAGIGGTEFSLADGPGFAGPGIELRAGDFNTLSPSAFWPSCGCPDIAHTKTFRSEGLGYVGSPEFTEAIRAVANGASGYSPVEIPPDMRVAAENWIRYIKLTSDWESDAVSPDAFFQLRDWEEMLFPKGKYACSPSLVHLASLEYIKTQGRQGLPPVSPRSVRLAIVELERMVAAKRQMARSLAARATVIGSKIAEAERMGAGNCSPRGVARAKMELLRASIEARMVRSTPAETASSFDRAELFADYLPTQRRLASSRGSDCQ